MSTGTGPKSENTDRPCRVIWDAVRDGLVRMNAREVILSPAFRGATGSNGRVSLEARCWMVGEPGSDVECRAVYIAGPTVEVFNAMFFPTRPEAHPLYTAEVLFFGGKPRVCFVDLQTTGLAGQGRDAVKAATVRLAAEYQRSLTSEAAGPEVPGWAVEYSPGGYVFTRTIATRHTPIIIDVCQAYFQLWSGFVTERRGAGGMPDEAAAQTLARYKRHHLDHSPGPGFLGKMFGDDWTQRFLNDFLYR